MDVYGPRGSIFHVLFPLAHVKKSLIAMCNVNIFNMLCFRTCENILQSLSSVFFVFTPMDSSGMQRVLTNLML